MWKSVEFGLLQIKKTDSQDRMHIGNKWVFKEKRDGVSRKRYMALGYFQVPGLDHSYNYRAVINGTSLGP
jgi:hypothetical protein